MLNLGFGEILLILVFVLLFIGPKKLPGLAKGLGKGMREFNDALRGITSPDNNSNSAPDEVTDKTASSEAQDHPSEHPVDHSDLEEEVAHDHDEHLAEADEVAETKSSAKKS